MTLIPVVCTGLGVWQYKRRKWKLGLLQQIEEMNSKAPVEFDPEAEYAEYERVKTRGVYDYSHEWFMGPRHEITPDGEKGQAGGFHTVSPMTLEDGTRVLVDRGWVPKVTTRTAGLQEGRVAIRGRIRGPEKEVNVGFEKLHPEATVMFYRASDIMAAQSNSLPITIELDAVCDVEGGPYGGQTRTVLYNKHLEYMIMWFGLAFFSLFYIFSFKRTKKAPRVFK